ncbi:pyridoxamine 5'-phosphate oxidase family protein [Streptomyces sp. NPDC057137]|uniref:pyridoxamine 5'-phosphate oxidase family protein n=1 Tax=Streptomyces sp. NPDC057137 TaxID=3346030 RepID=UPI00362C6345
MGQLIMNVTNPWLAGPAPKERLDPERLEERILNLLSSQNMCVLATAGAEGPLATPVRYFHLDFAVMFTAAPGSPKMRNLAADPRASVGILSGAGGRAGGSAMGAGAVHVEDRGQEAGKVVVGWPVDVQGSAAVPGTATPARPGTLTPTARPSRCEAHTRVAPRAGGATH